MADGFIGGDLKANAVIGAVPVGAGHARDFFAGMARSHRM